MPRQIAVFACALVLAAACTTSSQSLTSPSPGMPGAPTAPPSAAQATPSIVATPATAPTPTPSPYPPAALPVHGKDASIRLAPTSAGALYALVPAAKGAVLVLLDRTGAPAVGWPVTLPHATGCEFVEAASDGSVRAICNGTDIKQPTADGELLRAFALDAGGHPLGGWPVEVQRPAAARVVGNDLVLVSERTMTDGQGTGSGTSEAQLARVTPDGTAAQGVRVQVVHGEGWESWAVGPDGVAYATSRRGAGTEPDQVLAIDMAGAVSGWPVTLPSNGSPPAFDADGRAVVLVGAEPQAPFESSGKLRAVAIDTRDPATVAVSDPLPIEVGFSVDCGDSPLWRAPLIGGGVTTVWDEMSFYALDAGLRILPGWPYRAPGSLQEWAYPPTGNEEGGLDCSTYADPVLGPDGTLFIPLGTDSESTGGSLVAVAQSGKTVTGWPVALRRAGSGFWSVAVGADGTVFTAAVERDAGGLSATILGIAPDSKVIWKRTVLEP